MKKSSLYALAAAGLLLAACSDNAPKELVGTISDASMNTLTVKTLERTVTFTTEGADMQQANGLLLGSPVTVEYRGKLTDATPALKVATNPTYYQAVGSWTQPNPIDPVQRQGVELQVEGVARSIGMPRCGSRHGSLRPNRDTSCCWVRARAAELPPRCAWRGSSPLRTGT